MFVPLLVASHNAVTVILNEVKEFEINVLLRTAFQLQFSIWLLKVETVFFTIITIINIILIKNQFLYDECKQVAYQKIEHKHIKQSIIEETWRIALMHGAFKKDDL